MSRSLQVKRELIIKVKNALHRNEFPSQNALAKEMGISRATINNFMNGKPVDYGYFTEICEKLRLNWQEIAILGDSTVEHPPEEPENTNILPLVTHQDWGNAPDVSAFFGRTEELNEIKQWIVKDRCRIVALLGIEGIGKTYLAIKLAREIQNEFQYVIRRSLQNQPSIKELLEDLIKFFSNQQEIIFPDNIHDAIDHLIFYSRKYRCLLIFDNFESICQECTIAGKNCNIAEEYNQLLGTIGKIEHQSCLILTSREKPGKFNLLEGNSLPVRSYKLNGLQKEDIKKNFQNVGSFSASETDWQELVDRYDGNPQLLKMVASNIQDLFGGNIASFLKHNFFNGIHELLKGYFQNLSEIERDLMYYLAIHRSPMNLLELKRDFFGSISDRQFLDSIKSLNHRSLIESVGEGVFSQKNLILEYIVNELIEKVCNDLKDCHASILDDYPLVIASAKHNIIKNQYKLIIEPVVTRLLGILESKENIENHCHQILISLKNVKNQKGYAASNIISILKELKINLVRYDFSNLIIKQAYLIGIDLQQVALSNADLQNCSFYRTYGNILSVDLSTEGKFLAIGDSNGQIYLWELVDERPVFRCIYKGHTHSVRSITFSPDRKILASGSDDRTVRLWDVSSGKCLAIFDGHINRVRWVSFNLQGNLLASSSDDRTVRIWDVNRRELHQTLSGHGDKIRTVIFSSDGKIIVSASQDGIVYLWNIDNCEQRQILKVTDVDNPDYLLRSIAISSDDKYLVTGSDDAAIRLWDIATGNCLKTLTGHINWIRQVTISPDGKIIASASEDETIRIWDIESGQCLQTLQGHKGRVWSIAFNFDSKQLASGSDDRTAKLWDINTGECLRTSHGYSQEILSICFSPDGKNLASSSSNDPKIELWDVATGKIFRSLEGHTGKVWSVAFSPDGKYLVSASDDRTVKLWDLNTNICKKTFTGHTNWIRSVTFSPDGQSIVSGSDDKTLRIWHINTGESKVIQAHQDWIWSIAVSPDGHYVVSGSDDKKIKLWDINNGDLLNTFNPHKDRIWSIAIDPNGKKIASGSIDRTVKLLELQTGRCLQTFNEHEDFISTVAFSPNGKMLASGSYDQTIRLWDVEKGECLSIFQGHGKAVVSVAFTSDSSIIASGSKDGMIKLWNVQTGECLKTLSIPKPYEGMNITGVRGLNDAQKEMLKALGAVENDQDNFGF